MPDFGPLGTLETDAYVVRFALNATVPVVDAELLDTFRTNGVSHVNIAIGGGARDETLAELDGIANMRDSVLLG